MHGKNFLKNIFHPFVQADQGARSQYKGTGLGMAIVKELLGRMGGTIQLEKDEKTTGKYMAQITEKRVRARLDQYSMLSALLGNYISAGENLDENTFSELAEKIPNEDGVIKAFELAPEGIVTDIYPKEGNEGAFGLDMLQEHERKKDAILARDSGKYTLGGPYQLKQGGTGALLFNPVYQDNNSEQDEFWGFVILVIDWDRFIGEINLDYLSDADFCYRIWTYDRGSSDKIILAESQDNMSDNILTVECTVPNNTWYFDIIPSRGWIPVSYTHLTLPTILRV